MPVTVISYADKRHGIDTTSRSTSWSRGLSPFFLGPCVLYDWHVSQNVENAWQYSKVYKEHVDGNGDPSEKYWEWARNGWRRYHANRYPMGKGRKPLYSYWSGEKLDYVTARKRIYVPIYAKSVMLSDAFRNLKEIYDVRGEVVLRDFDGYDHRRQGKTLLDVVNDPVKKMGHAFVLAMILEGIDWGNIT